MSKEVSENNLLINKQRLMRLGLLGAVIVIPIVVWLLYTKVYQSPSNVFWAMIDNSLSTNSVIEQLNRKTSSYTVNQTIQLQLGAQNLTHAEATISNSGSQVTTEEISTPTQDFVRYLSINTPKKSSSNRPLDFSSLIGLWGEADVSSSSPSSIYQLFYQSIFGVIPIANLNFSQRQSIVSYMRSSNLYKPDYSSVTQQTLDGRNVFVYHVSVNLSDYINMLKKLGHFVNATQLQLLDPASYSSSQDANYSVVIDSTSHQLVEVLSQDGSQQLKYDGYGLSSNVELPTQTIPLNTLQSGVQTID